MNFEQAQESSVKLRQVATRPELAQMHGYYKQAHYGENTTGRPSMADFTGRERWQHWRDLKEMSEVEAKRKYIAVVDTCLAKYKDLIY